MAHVRIFHSENRILKTEPHPNSGKSGAL